MPLPETLTEAVLHAMAVLVARGYCPEGDGLDAFVATGAPDDDDLQVRYAWRLLCHAKKASDLPFGEEREYIVAKALELHRQCADWPYVLTGYKQRDGGNKGNAQRRQSAEQRAARLRAEYAERRQSFRATFGREPTQTHIVNQVAEANHVSTKTVLRALDKKN